MVSGRLTVAERGAVVDVGWGWTGHPVRVGIVVVDVVVFVKMLSEEGKRVNSSAVKVKNTSRACPRGL